MQLCQKALPAGSKIRTTVPYVKGDGFNKWWDSLSKRDLKFLLESKCQFGTKTPKEIMGARIRHPGGYHEHFMVSRQLVFKG